MPSKKKSKNKEIALPSQNHTLRGLLRFKGSNEGSIQRSEEKLLTILNQVAGNMKVDPKREFVDNSFGNMRFVALEGNGIGQMALVDKRLLGVIANQDEVSLVSKELTLKADEHWHEPENKVKDSNDKKAKKNKRSR